MIPRPDIQRFPLVFRATKGLALGFLIILGGCGDTTPTASLEERVELVREARDAGDLRTAIRELRSALQDHPEATSERFLLGQLYLNIHDGAAAEVQIQRARAQGADPFASLVLLGEAWLLSRQYDKVLDELTVNRNLPPRRQSTFHVIRGDAFRGLGRSNDAERAYRAALALDRSNAAAHAGLGAKAMEDGDVVRALVHLESAKEFGAGHARVLILEGDIATVRGDFTGALDAYSRLLSLWPESLLHRVLVAGAYARVDRLDEARRAIQLVREMMPDLPAANHVKGLIAYRAGQYEAASAAAARALRSDPGQSQSHLVLGAADFALGRFESAHASVQRYLARAPRDQTARVLLANIQMEMGLTEQAVATMELLAPAHDAPSSEPEGHPDPVGIGPLELDPRLIAVRLRHVEALVAADRAAEAIPILNQLLHGDHELADDSDVERLLLQLSE